MARRKRLREFKKRGTKFICIFSVVVYVFRYLLEIKQWTISEGQKRKYTKEKIDDCNKNKISSENKLNIHLDMAHDDTDLFTSSWFFPIIAVKSPLKDVKIDSYIICRSDTSWEQ